MIPYFALIVKLHIYNSYPGLVLTYMVFTLPYGIIMLTGYFNTLPRDLDEAVKIDGGSAMTTLWRVLVPIAKPGIVTVGIYNFMICWNEFLFALTLTKTNEMRTVPVGIQLLMGQHAYKWNEMMAMSALGCLPILILFLFFQSFFNLPQARKFHSNVSQVQMTIVLFNHCGTSAHMFCQPLTTDFTLYQHLGCIKMS
jgi:multiple sugar transport system permease protein